MLSGLSGPYYPGFADKGTEIPGNFRDRSVLGDKAEIHSRQSDPTV